MYCEYRFEISSVRHIVASIIMQSISLKDVIPSKVYIFLLQYKTSENYLVDDSH